MKSEDKSNHSDVTQAIETLLSKAKEHDWTINWRTADEIAEIGKAAVPRLIQALTDDDGYIRNAAAIALGKIGDANAVEPLIAAMRYRDNRIYEDGEDSEARVSAALALGKICDPRSYEPLVETLTYALSIKDARENDLTLSWYIIDALGMLGDKRAIPILENLRKHSDIDVRKSVATALKQINET